MKKIISIILSIILIISLTALATGCKKQKVELKNSWDVPDYINQGSVVEGKSALTLFNEALENHNNAEFMTYIRSMDFDAGIVATQQTIDITKISSGKVFTQGTKQGTAAGKTNDASRFFYDGTKAYELKVKDKDSETRFPELGSEDWSGLEYSDYDTTDKSVSDKLKDIKNFSLYVINEDTLADSHDDKVYKYNDKYYICLTINCMGIDEGTTQKDVEEDIMRGLGSTAKSGTFEWVSDTKIYLEITEDQGKYYFSARNQQENYKAVQAILPVTCEQVVSGTYAFDSENAEITAEEKLNKA